MAEIQVLADFSFYNSSGINSEIKQLTNWKTNKTSMILQEAKHFRTNISVLFYYFTCLFSSYNYYNLAP